MRRTTDLLFLLAFAGTLWGLALWLLSHGTLQVPMRRGAGHFVLAGWRLWAVAASPALAGTALWLAARRVGRGGRLAPNEVTTGETACFLGGIALLLLGLLSAPRVLS